MIQSYETHRGVLRLLRTYEDGFSSADTVWIGLNIGPVLDLQGTKDGMLIVTVPSSPIDSSRLLLIHSSIVHKSAICEVHIAAILGCCVISCDGLPPTETSRN